MPSWSTITLEKSLILSPKVEHVISSEKSVEFSSKVEYSHFL